MTGARSPSRSLRSPLSSTTNPQCRVDPVLQPGTQVSSKPEVISGCKRGGAVGPIGGLNPSGHRTTWLTGSRRQTGCGRTDFGANVGGRRYLPLNGRRRGRLLLQEPALRPQRGGKRPGRHRGRRPRTAPSTYGLALTTLTSLLHRSVAGPEAVAHRDWAVLPIARRNENRAGLPTRQGLDERRLDVCVCKARVDRIARQSAENFI